MTEKDGEPKRERGKWTRAGSGVPAATTFAGNIMALVAYAMLFDDGEPTGEPSGAAAPSDGGDLDDPES